MQAMSRSAYTAGIAGALASPRDALAGVREYAIFPVLLAALAVRLWGAADASLWIDEAFTIGTSALPLSTLWITAYDPTPPLFYTVEKFMLLFGDGEFLLRLPSIVFGVASIYAMYAAARLVSGLKGALAVAIVLALSTANIEYAQEARAYALLGMMISFAFLGLVRLDRFVVAHGKPATLGDVLTRGGLLYALATLGALYTHNVAVFFVFGVQLYFAALFVLNRDAFGRLFRYWLGLNFAIFVCWLPWLAASIEVSRTGVFAWLGHVGIEGAIFAARAVHGLPLIGFGQPVADLVLASLMLAGLYFLRDRPSLLVLVASLLLASSLLTWLFGFIKPVFMIRTILWGSLFSAFLLGVSLARLKAPFYAAALAVTSLAGMQGVANFHASGHSENEDWKSAVGFVEDGARAADTLLLCADYVKDAFAYYADASKLRALDVYGFSPDHQVLRKGIAAGAPGARPAISWRDGTVDPGALRAGGRLWIVRSHCSPDEMTPVAERLAELGFSGAANRHFKQIDVSVHERARESR